ncbi:MAG: hypothetical protein IKE74_04950 [Mogibacterium sp.]|nr:hypothetical protein [Mogibacterium sp.]
MCFTKKAEKPVSENEEKDVALKEEDIEEVSGGIKWGDGERPTLKDAASNDRKRRK